MNKLFPVFKCLLLLTVFVYTSQYVTSFYYGQETNKAQASYFVNNEVLHDNWERALTINDDFKKITL